MTDKEKTLEERVAAMERRLAKLEQMLTPIKRPVKLQGPRGGGSGQGDGS